MALSVRGGKEERCERTWAQRPALSLSPPLAASLAPSQAQALNAALGRAELGISALCWAGVS